MKYIPDLPFYLKDKIYKEYVVPDILFSTLMSVLESEDSQNLIYEPLTTILKRVISNDILRSTLISNDTLFRTMYHKHFILKENQFKLVKCPYKSMALNWLMVLYH